MMDVKTAIRTGDATALETLLSADPALVNRLVEWGTANSCRTHPLHYVSDMLFEGALAKGRELPLIDALIEAGADVNFQRDGRGDTPLIGAASLGAEEVGLRLLAAGAKPYLLGLSGETALHWAALLGEDRLVKGLLDGADLNRKDAQYQSPPLGWAIHGWEDPPAGNAGRQREAILLLLGAGAVAQPQWMRSDKVRGDAEIAAALQARIDRDDP